MEKRRNVVSGALRGGRIWRQPLRRLVGLRRLTVLPASYSFDDLAMDLARGVSRREVLRRAGRSFAAALVASLALGEMAIGPARADVSGGNACFSQCDQSYVQCSQGCETSYQAAIRATEAAFRNCKSQCPQHGAGVDACNQACVAAETAAGQSNQQRHDNCTALCGAVHDACSIGCQDSRQARAGAGGGQSACRSSCLEAADAELNAELDKCEKAVLTGSGSAIAGCLAQAYSTYYGLRNACEGSGCPVLQTCVNGACCPNGQVCNGGTVCCPQLSECINGNVCLCANNRIPCQVNGAEACVDPASDNANCGGCGRPCPTGATCENRICICGDGSPTCAGMCTTSLCCYDSPCQVGEICCKGSKGQTCSAPDRCCDGVICPDSAPNCVSAGGSGSVVCMPCPSGQQQCFATSGNTRYQCYDPSTQHCCQTSTGQEFVCSSAETCDPSGTCMSNSCPPGQSQCYGSCCPPGDVCCGPGQCYDPTDPSVTCCGSYICITSNPSLGPDVCCPTGGCCPHGNQCCGNARCYNPSFEQCCGSGDANWICPLTSPDGRQYSCGTSTADFKACILPPL